MSSLIPAGTEVLIYMDQSSGYVPRRPMVENPVRGTLLTEYERTSRVNEKARISTEDDEVVFGDQCSWTPVHEVK